MEIRVHRAFSGRELDAFVDSFLAGSPAVSSALESADLVFCEPDALSALTPMDGAVVVVLAKAPTIGQVLAWGRAGAWEVVDRAVPMACPSAVVGSVLDEVVERCRKRLARSELVESRGVGALLGEGEAIDVVRVRIRRVAGAPGVTVLLGGETGTGKDLVAEAIHYEDPGAVGAFVAMNCAAMPAALMERELFGHERGAFSDAGQAQEGLVQAAHRGTLFLDEVAELGLELQAKLLRVIETKRCRPIGGTRESQVEVRVVAATNCDLKRLVKEGRFRDDLYHRLNVIQLHLPPLRERGEDIELLVRHFSKLFAERHGAPAPRITNGAMSCLRRHRWPGNVRELRNAIERLVLLCVGGKIDEEDLPAGLRAREVLRVHDRQTEVYIATPLEDASLEEMERQLVSQVLGATRWNKTQACRILGISRPRILRLIARHDLRPELS